MDEHVGLSLLVNIVLWAVLTFAVVRAGVWFVVETMSDGISEASGEPAPGAAAAQDRRDPERKAA